MAVIFEGPLYGNRVRELRDKGAGAGAKDRDQRVPCKRVRLKETQLVVETVKRAKGG